MTTTSSPADRTPTDSTTTPQTIQGEPAMTTTTATAPETRPEEATGPDIAGDAGTDQRDTEHAAPQATGSARAGTTEDSGQASRPLPDTRRRPRLSDPIATLTPRPPLAGRRRTQ